MADPAAPWSKLKAALQDFDDGELEAWFPEGRVRPKGQARSGLEGLFDLPNPEGRREQARMSATDPEQTERATQLRERLRTWREKAGVDGSAELTKEEYDQLWISDLP